MFAQINEQVPMYVTLSVGGMNIKLTVWAGNQNRHDLAKVGAIFFLNSSKGSSTLSIMDMPTKNTNNSHGVIKN